MPFKTELYLKHIKGTELFELTAPLIYKTWEGILRTTPTGFVIDGHSYPDIVEAFVGNPVASETVEASVNHDHDRQDPEISDSLADRWYSQAMSDLGWNFKEKDKSFIWKWKRTFRRKRNWLGVRIGAFGNWVSKLWRRKDEEINDNID